MALVCLTWVKISTLTGQGGPKRHSAHRGHPCSCCSSCCSSSTLHLLCVGNVCILFLLLSLTYCKGKFPIRDNKDFYYYCNILHARRCLQKNMVTNSKAEGAAANVAPELHLQVEWMQMEGFCFVLFFLSKAKTFIAVIVCIPTTILHSLILPHSAPHQLPFWAGLAVWFLALSAHWGRLLWFWGRLDQIK